MHHEQKKFAQTNFFTDTGGDNDGEKSIWEPNIKTETLEETLDNNVELHFFETDDVLTKNPLLDLITEEVNDIEDILSADSEVKSKKSKNRTRKTNKSKRINTPEDNSSESIDNYHVDNDNDEFVGFVLDDIKNEESDETSEANNEFKHTVEKKKRQKRSTNRTEGKRSKEKEKPNEPKRRKGHALLEENESLIKKHIKMLCQMCSFIGEDFPNLIKHYKDEHTGVKPFIKCCERKLDCPSDILQHAYYHEDPEHFKCSECGKTFINNSGLKDHFMKHHEPEENLPYGCDECPRRFSRKNLLAHHKAKHIPKMERKHFCQICVPPRA